MTRRNSTKICFVEELLNSLTRQSRQLVYFDTLWFNYCQWYLSQYKIWPIWVTLSVFTAPSRWILGGYNKLLMTLFRAWTPPQSPPWLTWRTSPPTAVTNVRTPSQTWGASWPSSLSLPRTSPGSSWRLTWSDLPTSDLHVCNVPDGRALLHQPVGVGSEESPRSHTHHGAGAHWRRRHRPTAQSN